MQLIPILDARPGMRLARPIYSSNGGRILLQADIELKYTYIERIRALGYEQIYVHSPDEGQEPGNIRPIKEETRGKVSAALKSVFKQAQITDKLNIEALGEVVREIIDYILADPRTVYDVSQMRAYDRYTFTHSINVSVLSILTGLLSGFSRLDLEVLGVGALLHDIGKLYVNNKIIDKPAPLDPEEYELVKLHTRQGYHLLKSRLNVSYLVPHMAFQHHEREDGTGYPAGITGRQIHRFAKIIAVADVFDAMTSHRVYREPIPPYLAMQEITEHTPEKFDQATVEYFQKIIVPYPIGCNLRLNNGEYATVIHSSRRKLLASVTEGANRGQIYNLYQHPKIAVTDCWE